MYGEIVRWDMRLTDKAILEAIHLLDEPMSQAELADHLGCSRVTVMRAINRLSTYIEKSGPGKGKPYTYAIRYDRLPDTIRMELGA